MLPLIGSSSAKKFIKLSAVGLALLLIPRRSSRQSESAIPKMHKSSELHATDSDHNPDGEHNEGSLNKSVE